MKSLVVVYSTNYCPYCMRAKQLLKSKNIAFQEVDLTNDPATREKLAKETGWQTVPIIFIKNKFVGGFDDLSAMDRSGELAKLLRD